VRVVLRDDVENLGQKGDLVDVADGYARNYLVPRGLALKASAGSQKQADAMRRNRLAQNTMMRELCEAAGIPFLDTTSVLQQRVESGENVYFPDESHFNELGHQLVADALAEFLSTP